MSRELTVSVICLCVSCFCLGFAVSLLFWGMK